MVSFLYPAISRLALAVSFIFCVSGLIVWVWGQDLGVPPNVVSMASVVFVVLMIPLVKAFRYFQNQVENELNAVDFKVDSNLAAHFTPILNNFKGSVRVGVYNSGEINAFAISSWNGTDAAIGFSSALVSAANPQQLCAIAAHEVAHLINGDSAKKSAILGFNEALVTYPYLGSEIGKHLFKQLRWWFAALLVATLLSGLMTNNIDGLMSSVAAFVWTLAQFFWPVGLVIGLFYGLKFMLDAGYQFYSREREYQADQDGAKLTSNQAMKSALVLLTRVGPKPPKVSIFDSHPPINKRLARL